MKTTASERTGNDWKEISRINQVKIEDALVGHKRLIIASELNVSEGQLSKLSKLLNGQLRQFCDMCAVLGLSINPDDYTASLERILKEKL